MKGFDLNKFPRRGVFVCAVLHVGMLETESSTPHSLLIFSWGIWEPEENTHVRTNSHTRARAHTHITNMRLHKHMLITHYVRTNTRIHKDLQTDHIFYAHTHRANSGEQ